MRGAVSISNIRVLGLVYEYDSAHEEYSFEELCLHKPSSMVDSDEN